MRIDISALIVFLFIGCGFFSEKNTSALYVGELFIYCGTMHLYIVTETKLKLRRYVVTVT